jgi:hypothetical protein
MTRADRAVQVWQALLSAAHNRQTLTYSLLADQVGLAASELADPLGMVAGYCAVKQLPPLPVLVVQVDIGTPASGLAWASDPDFAREAVYQYAWFRLKPPSSSDFALVESMGFGEPVV